MAKSFEEMTPEELANNPQALLDAMREVFERSPERVKKRIYDRLHRERRLDRLAALSGAERAG